MAASNPTKVVKDISAKQGAVRSQERAHPSVSISGSYNDILALQRKAGNQAVSQMIQTKRIIGKAGDQYEQEEGQRLLWHPLNSTTSSSIEESVHKWGVIGADYSSKSMPQAKLKVNSPDDKYEKEADRVAETVVNSGHAIQPVPASAANLAVQRQPDDAQKPRDQPTTFPVEEQPKHGQAKEEEEKEKLITGVKKAAGAFANGLWESFSTSQIGKNILAKNEKDWQRVIKFFKDFADTMFGKIVLAAAAGGAATGAFLVAKSARDESVAPDPSSGGASLSRAPKDEKFLALELNWDFISPPSGVTIKTPWLDLPKIGGGSSSSAKTTLPPAPQLISMQKIPNICTPADPDGDQGEAVARSAQIYSWLLWKQQQDAEKMNALLHKYLRPFQEPGELWTPGQPYTFTPSQVSPITPLFKRADGAAEVTDPQAIEAGLHSSVQSLDPTTQADMEARFGYDFSQVRVHTDAQAAESARAVNARAYTVGQDVVFGAGQYRLGTGEGRRLLAHELAHVVQQSSGKHSIQRQEAQSQPLRSPSPRKRKPTGEVGHHVDVVFQVGANRWLVTIDGIPVAEIAVHSKETPLEVQVDIAGSAATVIIRHHGDAALAPVADPGASLSLSVSLREIDMREGAQGQAGPKEPPMPGETAGGTADIVIAPPSALRWPDEPVGEVSITTPLPPGALSEFEEKVRTNSSLIEGVVLDPDNPAEVIGYRVPATTGVTRLVDREGSEVFLDEIGLETPPVDPLDFIPTPGSAGKVGAGIIGRVGVKALGKKAAVKGTKVPLSIIARMRGVSKALFGRAARKGIAEAPGFVRKITKAGLDHSFDRHAAQWFGRVVSRETHYAAWRELVERVAASKQIFPWSIGAAKTIGHLGRVEGKYFVVQFFEETGELASAFVPNASQLREMLKLLKGAP